MEEFSVEFWIKKKMSATWQLMVCLLVVEPIPNETLMKSGILGVSYLELAQHTNWPLTLHNRFEKWTIFWQWNVKRTQFGTPDLGTNLYVHVYTHCIPNIIQSFI